MRLQRGVRLAPADDGRWQIRWDFAEVSFLEGPACRHVLPWLVPRLDGTRTFGELLEAPDRPCPRELLQEALDGLTTSGCLAAADDADSDLELSLAALGFDSEAAHQRLQHVKVLVCGRSPLAEQIVAVARPQGLAAEIRALESIDCQADSERVLPVVVESDWSSQQLEAFNESALAGRQDWMLVGAWNQRVLVGPIFVPGETACYVCYRRRLDSHRQHQAAWQVFDQWQRGQSPLPEPAPVVPALGALAAAWTGWEALLHLMGQRVARTRGCVLVYYPEEMRLELERVLRIPWCPQCARR